MRLGLRFWCVGLAFWDRFFGCKMRPAKSQIIRLLTAPESALGGPSPYKGGTTLGFPPMSGGNHETYYENIVLQHRYFGGMFEAGLAFGTLAGSLGEPWDSILAPFQHLGRPLGAPWNALGSRPQETTKKTLKNSPTNPSF